MSVVCIWGPAAGYPDSGSLNDALKLCDFDALGKARLEAGLAVGFYHPGAGFTAFSIH
jgi:hypothetical protein